MEHRKQSVNMLSQPRKNECREIQRLVRGNCLDIHYLQTSRFAPSRAHSSEIARSVVLAIAPAERIQSQHLCGIDRQRREQSQWEMQ